MTGTVVLTSRYAPLNHTNTGVYSPVGHTHTPASIGAADAGHTHTPESIGAATVDHLHTGVYSPVSHTHTPASIGASPAGHNHVAGPAPVTLTDAPTIATDATSGNHFRVTLTGNHVLGNPTGGVDGQRVLWELVQNGTGGRTLTLDSAFQFGADITAAVLSTAPGKRDFLGAVYDSTAAKWRVIAFAKGY